MKYFLTILSAAILLTSCMKDKTVEMNNTLVASFEYTDAKFDKDSVLVTSNKYGGFGWGDLVFYHKLTQDDKTLLGGFAVSCMRPRLTVTEELPANLFRQYGKPLDKKTDSNNYSVFKIGENPGDTPDQHIVFVNSHVGTCTPVGCYIANSEKVVEEIKNSFEKGDSLTVMAVGYLDNKVTAKLKKNLAKYSEQKDSIVSVWTPFMLEKLGSVDRINFEILSTKPEITKAFCIDNVVAQIHISY